MALQKMVSKFRKIVYGLIRRQQQLFRKYPLVLLGGLLLMIRGADAYIASISNILEYNEKTAFSLSAYSIDPLYIALCALCILVFIYIKIGKALVFPIIFIVASGLSNGIDRIFIGGVRDTLYIGNWNGNLADIFIGIGVVWAIYNVIRFKVGYAD